MNRAFLSLYFLVVVSVILVGWGTDRLWQVYNPEPEVEPFENAFFKLIESELSGLDLSEAIAKSRKVSVLFGQDVQIYSVEELAKSSLSEKITEGNIVSVFDDEGRKSSYKRIANTNYIVRVTLGEKNDEKGDLYFTLLIAFYLVIAIIIYFWIWPLSRDLHKLQLYTQKVGLDDSPNNIELSQSSTVYSLASAFNTMMTRIDELLATHKEMTYAVSHELRTPLARMKFALEMAKDTADVNSRERQIDSVCADVAEMEKLINELLTYAGFEQRREKLELKQGDLCSLIENIVDINQRIYSDKNISTQLIDELNKQPVYAEWYLLERCIHNVIQNAFKYCHERIWITLSIESSAYCVTIEDDGPGIKPEDADKVFQAFVRLRNGTHENKSGFGLGLAIVHRIMKWHNGDVSVVPSQQGGAKFILRWPLLA